MLVHVYLDNNVWDFLYEHKLDLAVELPSEEFRIFLTREAEFEIPPIASAALKAFIASTIQSCSISTDSLFGFSDDSLPRSEQRVGGWGEGRWASTEELAFIGQQKIPSGRAKKRKTGLYKDEADISLAARSFHSLVLSLDKKAGPINRASLQGGKVLFLNDFDKSKMSLKNFIQAALS